MEPNPAEPDPTVSVIICVYTEERWDDIESAVTSVAVQTRPALETIVVVDHNDALLTRLRARFPDLSVVPNEGRQGLSGARNTGVDTAKGDIVAFLDDDARAEPDWLARLIPPYADETVIGVGGFVSPGWRGPRPSWLPQEFLWTVGCSYEGEPTGRASVRNSNGANMSFRREVFEVAGGFDADLGRTGKNAAGCEETEFSIRARASYSGKVILFEPPAVVHHMVGPERLTRAYFRKRCRAEGRSKAAVTALAGSEAALSSERRYALWTLPRGVVRGFGDFARGDRSGLGRSYSIAEGLVLTAASYATTRAKTRARERFGPKVDA